MARPGHARNVTLENAPQKTKTKSAFEGLTNMPPGQARRAHTHTQTHMRTHTRNSHTHTQVENHKRAGMCQRPFLCSVSGTRVKETNTKKKENKKKKLTDHHVAGRARRLETEDAWVRVQEKNWGAIEWH